MPTPSVNDTRDTLLRILQFAFPRARWARADSVIEDDVDQCGWHSDDVEARVYSASRGEHYLPGLLVGMALTGPLPAWTTVAASSFDAIYDLSCLKLHGLSRALGDLIIAGGLRTVGSTGPAPSSPATGSRVWKWRKP